MGHYARVERNDNGVTRLLKGIISAVLPVPFTENDLPSKIY